MTLILDYLFPKSKSNRVELQNAKDCCCHCDVFLKGDDRDIQEYVDQHPHALQEMISSQQMLSALSEATTTITTTTKRAINILEPMMYPLAILICRYSASGQTKNNNHRENNGIGKTMKCSEASPQLSLETIQVVYKAFPAALLEQPCLHYALLFSLSSSSLPASSELELIQFLMDQNPEEVIASRLYGHHPLHTACTNPNISASIVQYILDCNPSAIRVGVPDHRTVKLPLHLAIVHGVSFQVLQVLVQAYPQAVEEPDYVVQGGAIHANRSPDPRGWYYHRAAKKKKDKEKPNPTNAIPGEEASYLALFGWYHNNPCGTPLHLACSMVRRCRRSSHGGRACEKVSSTSVSTTAPRPPSPLPSSTVLDIIHYLFYLYPRAIITKNAYGFLPFHYACKYGATLDILSFLYVQCPASIMEPTGDMQNAILVALSNAQYNQLSLQTIQYLLSKHPHTNLSKPISGLYHAYWDEADESPSVHPQIVQYLYEVVRASKLGYSAVPTFVSL